jgi:hypothetical protein
VDAYAGVSRGTEQWVVRASRSLHSDPETVNVGPISYEVVEPLHAVKVSLAANDQQPIAFEILFKSIVPCVVEQREDRRDMHGFRKATDQVRYHQTGVVCGWVEVDGVRTAIGEDSWISTRDKSWGVRPQVGVPIPDLEPDYHHLIPQALAIWNPMLFQREDGSRYAFHHYYLQFSAPGFEQKSVQGGLEESGGASTRLTAMTPDLRFEPGTKRLQGGEFLFAMEDGSERPMRFEKLSETGFYLGAGGYHGGDNHHHGSWRGELQVDGDYAADASQSEVLARYSQFRDCMIRVEDPVGGGIGWGNCQTYIHGPWPEFGLSGDEARL